MFQYILIPLIFLCTCISSCAHLPALSSSVKDQHVKAQLISELSSIKPGQSVWLGVVLIMDDAWHTYWKNPGDSGTPTSIRWTLPDGFKANTIQWPYPVRIEQAPLTSYGYEREVTLLTQIDVPDNFTGSSVKITANVDWLVCKVGCIPGHAELMINLPVSLSTPLPDPSSGPRIKEARTLLPLSKSGWTITAASSNKTLTLNFVNNSKEPLKLDDVYFYPERDDLILHAEPQHLTETRNGYQLSITRSSISSAPLTQLKGVLYSKSGWLAGQSNHALSIDLPVPQIKQSTKQMAVNLKLALFFAWLGGLILNLMPCVLPVISLKILSLVQQSAANTARLRIGGVLFTLGVVVSFWILAGLLILLKTAGHQIGWGFQFQSPLFLILLSGLFFLLALNLFGVFEILLPVHIQQQRTSGYLSNFLNGILATITATPCTAPFMGTALGFALTQPPMIAMLIFTFLGLGMAFPYLLLSFCPSLLKYIPKPGPWMILFKRFLGVLLLATVFWLLWILNAQINTFKDKPAVKAADNKFIKWLNYSPELIQELRQQGRIILIDFTAKWCLTCQVNERVALDNPAVIKKLNDLKVALVKADWTSYDPLITQALAEFGKNSIPLYVIYTQDPAKQPITLPELITPQLLLETLDTLTQKV